MQLIEIRYTVLATADSLTVDRRRSDAEHSQSNSDRWIPLGPVKAASREQADTPAVLAHDQAIAVVLDFMNPLPAAGRLRRERRITGLDEAGRQPHRPTRGTPLHARAIDAEANDCVQHMLQVLNAARKAQLRVFYAMHHRYRPGDYETWKYIAPVQKAAWEHKSFEYGSWGGEFRAEFAPKPGEIVVAEHWCSSGFANTDLDLQLKKHGIHKLIVIGLIAHTCIEATVRFAVELGYEVTVVKDATADYSDNEMRAALEVNLPNYASAIVTTKEIVGSIFSA
jgi:ureidoacrylate peracid hydrolase